jgi:hypothetical protein
MPICGNRYHQGYDPVVPAAHFLCGGIKVDTNGQSSIHSFICSWRVLFNRVARSKPVGVQLAYRSYCFMPRELQGILLAVLKTSR